MPARLYPKRNDDDKETNKIIIKGIILILMMQVFAFTFCTQTTITSVI